MRRMALVLSLLLMASSAQTPAHADDVFTYDVGFVVSNPLDPGASYIVHARFFLPAGRISCSSILLLVHGLSYGIFGWDFPDHPDNSVARALVARGYAAVAIDLPGYGPSTHPEHGGRVLTVESYAWMVHEIVMSLRVYYGHVGLVGHSAGTEISELEAALFGDVDALIATGYSHFPSQRIITDFVTGDYVRATTSDYEYFGGDVAGRTEYMYNTAVADPEIVTKDNELARLTPSGEIYSIGPQPSGKVMATINAPVLGVFAEKDLLFPIENADQEMALFAGSSDTSKIVAPDDGHSFMLHRNAPMVNAKIADWLDARPSVMPRCS